MLRTEQDVPFGDEEQARGAERMLTRETPAGERRHKPLVEVDVNVAEVADAAWLTLMEANGEREPRIMRRGGLVRLSADGTLKDFNRTSLRDRMSRTADYWKRGPKDKRVAVEAPLPIAEILLSRDLDEYWAAPWVDAVVTAPVLGASGRIIAEPGYHAGDRVYFRPAPGLEGVPGLIGDHELVDDVVDARRLLLDDLLGDFQFRDEASRANALGLLVLTFVQEYLGDDPTPMHAIASTDPGTGKSTLAQALLIPACGLVGVTTAATAGEEDRKRITAMLAEGPPAIIFDNLHDTVQSQHLAAALTTGEWRDRRLGHTEMMRLKIRNAWVSTANNPTMSREHARRTTMIAIEKRPAGYEWRHPNLIAWAVEHRAELAAAALTLVNHWLAGEARPTPGGEFLRAEARHQGMELASFERWADVVGGILAAADVPGFLGNRGEMLAADVETDEDTAFVEAWHAVLGEDWLTANEIAPRLVELADVLPETVADAAAEKRARALGYWLRARRGRLYGDLMLDGGRVGPANGRNPVRWRISKARAAS